MTKKYTHAHPSDIPEMREFEEWKRRLTAFYTKNEKLMDELKHLSEGYNAAWESAEKTLRATGTSSGDFQVIAIVQKYDADKAVEELGDEVFFQVGGTKVTIPTYKLDRVAFETAIAKNMIPDEVVESVRKTIYNYNKPPKVVLPF